jgi:hypothetical protein
MPLPLIRTQKCGCRDVIYDSLTFFTYFCMNVFLGMEAFQVFNTISCFP